MKLYNSNLSPYCSRCRILIYAKGLDVELVPPPEAGIKSPEYLAVNPMGKLPTLVTDSWSFGESEVINEYLEGVYPEPSLRPASAEGLVRARLLQRIVDLYLGPPLTRLFSQMDPSTRDAKVVEEALAELDKALGHIASYLDEGSYAVGDKLSHADCTLVPTLFFINALLPALGRPDPFVAASKVGAYFKAVRSDAAVAKVLGELQAALAERMAQGR